MMNPPWGRGTDELILKVSLNRMYENLKKILMITGNDQIESTLIVSHLAQYPPCAETHKWNGDGIEQ